MKLIKRVMDSLTGVTNMAARATGATIMTSSSSNAPPSAPSIGATNLSPVGPSGSVKVSVASASATAKKSRKLSRENISHDVVTEWEAIQEDLKTKIVQEDTEEWQRDPDLKGLKYIAGLDISYPVLPEGIAPTAVPADVKTEDDNENGVKTKPHGSSAAYVAVAVHSFPDLKLVYSDIQCVNLFVPYIPGFLAFRECQPLVDAVQKLIKAHPEWTPNVLLVDGNGILHPQQAGLASHVGFQTNLPCIGVSKNLFFFEGIEYRKSMGQNMNKTGDYIYLREGSDKILGMALKTANEAKNPVYVSIGHRISLDTARSVVLACSKYRIPEPIRTADHMSREFIRQLDQEQSQQ